ncbi:MAG TPA: 16S rRNA (guanine(527)-N(7))-methyltransferase RsmG [Planctomycetes bacterium]|nr:16S rRNA (guanine(527)-N(7))-methyltransferase RsmG [Planctomycetota bacterium]
MMRRRPVPNPLRRGRGNPFQPDPLDRLEGACKEAGIDLPRETLGQGLAYLVRMLEENKKLNLSGIRDLDRALILHLLDSLWIAGAVREAPARILDIGSGNGFPGAIAACIWPQAECLLVERTQKKARAIQSCLGDTHLSNARVLAEDAAALPAHHKDLRESCDLVLTRATGPIAAMNRLAAPLLRPGGSIFHWKSETVDAKERREGLISAKKLGLHPRDDLIYPLGERKRRLLRFQK